MPTLNLSPLRYQPHLPPSWGSLLWTSLYVPRHQLIPFAPTTRANEACGSALHPVLSSSSRAVGGSFLPRGTATQASPPSSVMARAEDDKLHIFAFCRTTDDAAKVQEAAKEVAVAASLGSTTPILHLGLADAPPCDAPTLDAARCCQHLAQLVSRGGTRTMGRVLLAAATLGSTQELLRTLGSILGDGAVVVADCQTSGKGRGGNQWTSPVGCLMFSAVRRLRVASPVQAPFINYLVCLAVTRGVRKALQESGLPALDLRIKWPNDIYAAGLKVAGALIHTTWQGGWFNVIAGIGLNVNNRTPTTCLDELLEQAASERTKCAGETDGNGFVRREANEPQTYISRESVLTSILASLEEVYDTFEQHGFAPLEPEYLATWLHSGQVLDVDELDTTTSVVGATNASRRVTRVTIRGLSSSGFLLAEDAGGSWYELTPDGNSLDMMQGLIRRKLQ
ncbi:hypothetical protein VaNZ11_014788 [Volvox africanus]|uniref:BPL/LPL catalytic domain-containing protein n=1 Tax=Volvox africanus TaxID=51714 RepID=A0ABQ5SJU2_9CHLO|nr:hypothetical protein VaNZ11_014788 [Volvox africanus]